jgi:peroxiredoxin
MPLLHPGDTFPRLTLNIAGAHAIEVPGWFAGEFGVVLFNRGAWCPYCTAQLRAFQRDGDSLAAAGIRVAALWADDEQTTAEFTARHGLTFPLGHSADARTAAALTGAFVNDDPLYLQSTGFVLDPHGKVIVSVYSSGAIGRLVPEDVTGLVRYLRAHAAASS